MHPCINHYHTRVAESVKNAIKAYEQTTSLPYDSIPTEVCRARDGTRSIDLAEWSLLVDDVALRCIAAGDRSRIDELAAQSSVNKVLLDPLYAIMLCWNSLVGLRLTGHCAVRAPGTVSKGQRFCDFDIRQWPSFDPYRTTNRDGPVCLRKKVYHPSCHALTLCPNNRMTWT